jgi:glycine dehydrogenase
LIHPSLGEARNDDQHHAGVGALSQTPDRNQQDAAQGLSPFVGRHIGPRNNDVQTMLATLGMDSLNDLLRHTIPAQIFPDGQPTFGHLTQVGDGMTEAEILAHLRGLADQNQIFKSYIGTGYADCVTPPVILRNLLEDPRWYTPYTPYQAEVAQGRLESLLNFQTMIMDLTGMEIANASLLDEATAAAEAMHMAWGVKGAEGKAFFVAADCHPQTIAVVQSRAVPLGIEVIVGDPLTVAFDRPLFGALVQYPATDGVIRDYSDFVESVHTNGGLAVVAAELLGLTLITPPGEWGADIVVGSAQRFGVPLGYGGPHAGYFATKDAYKRQIPGRLIGVSRDAEGRNVVRLTLQTREQHIRRDKATSNICTAQALLANVAAMYAVYHGPEGLRAIAAQIHQRAVIFADGLREAGFEIADTPFFDTVRVPLGERSLSDILARAQSAQINLRVLNNDLNNAALTVTMDETTTAQDVDALLAVFEGKVAEKAQEDNSSFLLLSSAFQRRTAYLTHPIFNKYRSELELQRYMNRLANKDLSLSNSMIALGSCTMKLNAAVEMMPITWPEFGKMHPFAPLAQAQGYQQLITRLETMLADITGFAAVSLQPNAGSQGEYAGLLVIRQYHQTRGEGHRNVCLIPHSAHGTNPASAAMAGMKIVVVDTDEAGNIDVADLERRAEEHKDNLSALMVTYPSTHGVFEEAIVEICEAIHQRGGQVYMDGANMNAMMALCRPGDFGPDVCHLNLHKTFCIPHGGGGPGVGPIGVAAHLAPFLPTHPFLEADTKAEDDNSSFAIGPIAAAPFGSASILPISYAYILLMGAAGLRRATEVAILNANYVARRLDEHYPVLYRGKEGMVAHECILDLRPLQASAGVTVEDIAKRLMDFGFHPPTMSWPVSGTFMIEPTESESKEELDRFCDALIAIRQEIRDIEEGRADRANNPLKFAPHTAEAVTKAEWEHPYSREQAAYPLPWVRESKYWPPVARVDNVFGDRNVVCACPSIDEYK